VGFAQSANAPAFDLDFVFKVVILSAAKDLAVDLDLAFDLVFKRCHPERSEGSASSFDPSNRA
jgi:hypothetical protein